MKCGEVGRGEVMRGSDAVICSFPRTSRIIEILEILEQLDFVDFLESLQLPRVLGSLGRLENPDML